MTTICNNKTMKTSSNGYNNKSHDDTNNNLEISNLPPHYDDLDIVSGLKRLIGPTDECAEFRKLIFKRGRSGKVSLFVKFANKRHMHSAYSHLQGGHMGGYKICVSFAYDYDIPKVTKSLSSQRPSTMHRNGFIVQQLKNEKERMISVIPTNQQRFTSYDTMKNKKKKSKTVTKKQYKEKIKNNIKNYNICNDEKEENVDNIEKTKEEKVNPIQTEEEIKSAEPDKMEEAENDDTNIFDIRKQDIHNMNNGQTVMENKREYNKKVHNMVEPTPYINTEREIQDIHENNQQIKPSEIRKEEKDQKTDSEDDIIILDDTGNDNNNNIKVLDDDGDINILNNARDDIKDTNNGQKQVVHAENDGDDVNNANMKVLDNVNDVIGIDNKMMKDIEMSIPEVIEPEEEKRNKLEALTLNIPEEKEDESINKDILCNSPIAAHFNDDPAEIMNSAADYSTNAGDYSIKRNNNKPNNNMVYNERINYDTSHIQWNNNNNNNNIPTTTCYNNKNMNNNIISTSNMINTNTTTPNMLLSNKRNNTGLNTVSTTGLSKKHKFKQKCRLFVENINPNIGDNQLKTKFEKFGTVSSAKIMRDPATNASKGCGFITFKSHKSSKRAIKSMNGTLWYNQKIRVSYVHDKTVTNTLPINTTNTMNHTHSTPPTTNINMNTKMNTNTNIKTPKIKNKTIPRDPRTLKQEEHLKSQQPPSPPPKPAVPTPIILSISDAPSIPKQAPKAPIVHNFSQKHTMEIINRPQTINANSNNNNNNTSTTTTPITPKHSVPSSNTSQTVIPSPITSNTQTISNNNSSYPMNARQFAFNSTTTQNKACSVTPPNTKTHIKKHKHRQKHYTKNKKNKYNKKYMNKHCKPNPYLTPSIQSLTPSHRTTRTPAFYPNMNYFPQPLFCMPRIVNTANNTNIQNPPVITGVTFNALNQQLMQQRNLMTTQIQNVPISNPTQTVAATASITSPSLIKIDWKRGILLGNIANEPLHKLRFHIEPKAGNPLLAFDFLKQSIASSSNPSSIFTAYAIFDGEDEMKNALENLTGSVILDNTIICDAASKYIPQLNAIFGINTDTTTATTTTITTPTTTTTATAITTPTTTTTATTTATTTTTTTTTASTATVSSPNGTDNMNSNSNSFDSPDIKLKSMSISRSPTPTVKRSFSPPSSRSKSKSNTPAPTATNSSTITPSISPHRERHYRSSERERERDRERDRERERDRDRDRSRDRRHRRHRDRSRDRDHYRGSHHRSRSRSRHKGRHRHEKDIETMQHFLRRKPETINVINTAMDNNTNNNNNTNNTVSENVLVTVVEEEGNIKRISRFDIGADIENVVVDKERDERNTRHKRSYSRDKRERDRYHAHRDRERDRDRHRERNRERERERDRNRMIKYSSFGDGIKDKRPRRSRGHRSRSRSRSRSRESHKHYRDRDRDRDRERDRNRDKRGDNIAVIAVNKGDISSRCVVISCSGSRNARDLTETEISNFVGGSIERIIKKRNPSSNASCNAMQCQLFFYIKFEDILSATQCFYKLQDVKNFHCYTLTGQSMAEKTWNSFFPAPNERKLVV